MKNYGLLEGMRDARDFVFGAFKVPSITYRADGNWEPFLPLYEPQAETYETNGCTVWGTQNQIETFYNGVYGTEPNYSERYTYLLTPIDPDRGADPQRVYQCIRHEGLIPNSLFPVPDTKEEFLNVYRINAKMRDAGERWLEQHELKWEWLWNERPLNYLDVMKKALTLSPLGVSVTAWRKVDDKYVSTGGGNNHWCMCYRIDDEGIHVFDSYNHSKKVLSLDHNIRRATRIWVNKTSIRGAKKQISFLQTIINFLKKKL